VLLRKDVIKTLRTLRMDQQKLTWNYIINMKDLKHKLEYDIISIYKQLVWNNLTKIRWEGETINPAKYRIELQKEVDFYIRNIHKI